MEEERDQEPDKKIMPFSCSDHCSNVMDYWLIHESKVLRKKGRLNVLLFKSISMTDFASYLKGNMKCFMNECNKSPEYFITWEFDEIKNDLLVHWGLKE